jgi:O-antigen/teichoic acid export membrane protein
MQRAALVLPAARVRRRRGRPFAHNGAVLSTEAPAAVTAPDVVRLRSGARSGALLAAASGASIVAAYLFLLAAGRILGSDEYGSLAALLGLLAIVLIPAGALQMAVSREVSRHVASGDRAGAARLARGTLRAFLIATAPLLAVALALAGPISSVLHIHSVPIVVLAVLTLSTALVFPLAMGFLQGLQRFPALAGLYLFPWLVRLALLLVTAAAGYRLGGAIFATFAGAVAGTALALGLIREPLRGAGRLPRAELATFLRYLSPVAVGLVGIALLTHVDILIVKARFSGDEAGAYAAASAFARVGFFLPATILAVLFPRTAARQARGEETRDILGRSLLATAAFCGLLALVYAATGAGLVSLTFGRDFAEGGEVLAPFALAIGLFSLANVLVGYHLSRGETRYAWIVGAGVLVQVTVLATLPSSLHGVVWTNVLIGVGLLAAHELVVGSSAPALRAGLRHVSAATRLRIRRITLETGLVLLGATAFVSALMWPVVVHLGSTITGSLGSDSTGSVAWFWTLQHESGFHVLGTTHHTFSGAPFGWNEGNGLNIQWLLPYYPAYLATKLFGAVAAYNLVTLAGYVLSGASMYLLTRYLGCARPVAVWAGLVFIVFPWHLARAEHASLTHIEVLALLVLALVAAARRPTWLRFGYVAAATLACWLTSGYFGGMAVITAIAFALGAALTTSRRRGLLLVAGSTGAALLASGLVAIGSYASGANAGAGIHRDASALYAYGLRPVELVVPTARHLVFGLGLDSFWLRHAHGSNTTELSNYLGLLTFALAIAWIVVVLRRRRTLRGTGTVEATAGLVATFVVGFLFALPSPVGGVSLPSRWLWNLVSAFRVPSRWDPLLMTALLPLAALGLQTLWRALGDRRQLARVALVAAAIAVSFAELSIHLVPRFRTVPLPPEYTALESKTRPGVLAEYPLGYSDIYRLWQRVHDRPLVNGAAEGTTADQARLALLDPAQPGTAQALSLLGVTAIAVHPGGHADVPVQPREPTAQEGYRLVGRFPDGASVWSVVAQPAPAFVMPFGGFAAPRREGNGPVTFALVSAGGFASFQLRAKTAGVVRLSFDLSVEGSGSATFHVYEGSHDVGVPVSGTTPVSVAVQVPRGVSQLLVSSEGAGLVDVSQPRAEATQAQPVLNARPLSPDPGF